jgi:hypothetical protein
MPLTEPRESQVTINFHGFSVRSPEDCARHVAGRIIRRRAARINFAGLSFPILNAS